MDSSKITINNQDFLSPVFVGPLVEITNSLKYLALFSTSLLNKINNKKSVLT